jgi:hypothetical protein
LEVVPPVVPIEELTRSSSPGSMLPQAMSEALGISLSEVLDLYFRKLDEVRRGCLIGDVLDRRMLGEWDHKLLEEESRRRDATEISLYQEDDDFLISEGIYNKGIFYKFSVRGSEAQS